VYEFIRRGSFDRHLERLGAELSRRRDAMVVALERHLPGASWVRPQGGFHVMVELPLGTNAEALLAGAGGVEALAGTALGGWPNMVGLSYGELAPAEIELGVERLAAALGAGAETG
jgi:DNA-binding transcriptional MocR family regulator